MYMYTSNKHKVEHVCTFLIRLAPSYKDSKSGSNYFDNIQVQLTFSMYMKDK